MGDKDENELRKKTETGVGRRGGPGRGRARGTHGRALEEFGQLTPPLPVTRHDRAHACVCVCSRAAIHSPPMCNDQSQQQQGPETIAWTGHRVSAYFS